MKMSTREDRLAWLAVGGPANTEALRAALRAGSVDWQRLIRIAHDNRVSVPLAQAMRPIPGLPIGVRAALLREERDVLRQVDAIRERFERALPTIVENDPVILLRGIADVYTHPADAPLRPVGADVDLLIERPRYASISGRFVDHHHVPSAVMSVDPPELEYHADPNFKTSWCVRLAAIDSREIWRRRETMRIAGCEVGLLSVEDDLLCRSFHNVAKGFVVLYRFADLVTLVRDRAPDWATVVERARRWRIATSVWANLSVVNRLVAELVPEDVLDQLRPGRELRRVFEHLFDPSLILHDPRRLPWSWHRLCRTARKELLFRLLVLQPRTAPKILIGPVNRRLFGVYSSLDRTPLLRGLVGRARTAIQGE